jgi:hypothetical protein
VAIFGGAYAVDDGESDIPEESPSSISAEIPSDSTLLSASFASTDPEGEKKRGA